MADGIPLDNESLELASLAAARHADSFGSIRNGSNFPPQPSTADWEDYSRVEQSHARFAARAVVEAYLGALAAKGVLVLTPADGPGGDGGNG